MYTWQGVLIDTVFIGLVIAAMLIPWWLAKRRGDPHRTSILIVSLFAGWTFFGWVLALAFAVRGKNWAADADKDLTVDDGKEQSKNKLISYLHNAVTNKEKSDSK